MVLDNHHVAVPVIEERPLGVLEYFEREFEGTRQRMRELFRRPAMVPFGRLPAPEHVWAPAADMFAIDGALVLQVELPGVRHGDITVTVDDGIATVEGRRVAEQDAGQPRYFACERFAGPFSRSFVLPAGVAPAAITGTYRDGVLELRAPLPAGSKAAAVQIAVAP